MGSWCSSLNPSANRFNRHLNMVRWVGAHGCAPLLCFYIPNIRTIRSGRMWQPNKLEQERVEKVQRIEALGVEPYPRRVMRTHTTARAIAEYEALETQDA